MYMCEITNYIQKLICENFILTKHTLTKIERSYYKMCGKRQDTIKF